MEYKIYTPQELKQQMQKAREAYTLPFERQEWMNHFTPEPDTFEVVISKKGEKVLIPCARDYPFLFRGQEREYKPCLPTIYRNNATDVEVFLNRMRFVVFKKLLDSHPVVNGFFNRHGFNIDYEGLAQHYGLSTEVLDFTDDLDIALFFAMCPYDKDQDRYTWMKEDGERQAVIYIIRPSLDYVKFPKFEFTDKLNSIGLQPFARPRLQRGFGVHVLHDEVFRPILVEISYTSKESYSYYLKFGKGEKLWIKDELCDKTLQIAKKKHFSFNVFDETWNSFRPMGYSKTKLKSNLKNIGVALSKDSTSSFFSDTEKREIIERWNGSVSKEMQQKICRRVWRDNKVGNRYLDEHLFSLEKHVCQLEALRMITGAVTGDCPGHYVTYNESKNKKKYQTYGSEWQKLPEIDRQPKSEPFLTDEDMKLNVDN
ncbi:MAG: FRG domain-containing protein [Paludibacteraceae bacterium]|nr:FRG domain-containing protein [Paludibacteraceae bacterium]HOU69269.1 FRG domain-containing protein [Paludibacteraceae bacterium]